MPVHDVMGVAHLGIGHVDGMVGSGIEVIYSSRLVVWLVEVGFSCGSSKSGSSLCTCLRWLMRLPCCMGLSHLGQLIMVCWH